MLAMSEFAKRTKQELEKDLVEKYESLRKFRFGASGSSKRNVREGRDIRKDIARIHTALQAKGEGK